MTKRFFRPRRRTARQLNTRELRIEPLECRTVPTADPILSTALQFEVDPSRYEAGNVLVRFEDQPFGLQQVNGILQKTPANAAALGAIQQIADGWHTVQLPAGVSIQAALAVYRADPDVIYAEPNYLLHTTQLPNDPNLSDLWGLENTGQTGGTLDADIDAGAAWDVTTGSGNIVVAIIDTGIDYNHPDLAPNLWVNPGEIAGDGIDNDGNGYVDDVYGYDFINADGDPLDDQGHGTHVAGTVGAAGDNGLGISGVNWNVQLMALKFLGADASGTTADAIEAIYYARDMGADVINASWGGDPFSQALFDAIAATRDADQIFVAAAGNGDIFGIGINNDANPFYPAGYDIDNIIAVAASDHNDNIATFSNYGATTVDLAAPGVNVVSTTLGSSYGGANGTSMAAPHVAGVAALVRDLHPEWNYSEVIQQILGTVDPLPGLQGFVATGGRLNAASALGNPEPPPPPPPPVSLPVFEDFNDGQESFVVQAGNWGIDSQQYTATPVAENPDFALVSTVNLDQSLPSSFEFRAVMEAEQGFVSIFGIILSNHLTNGLLIYDYADFDNFKFAGADVDAGEWVIGRRVAGDWSVDAQVTDTSLTFGVQYEMRLLVENDTDVTFFADGVERLTYQYASSITAGAIGVGSRDSTTHFDDVFVQEYVEPTPAGLPYADSFDDGFAENFAPQLGVWLVDQGRYESIPALNQDGVSTLQLVGALPTNLEIGAVLNADDVSTGRLSNAFVIFDYQSPTDFKFAGAYVGVDRWLIGRRTAAGWLEDATLNESIDPLADYALTVRLEGDSVTLIVDGAAKLSHTFGDSLVDGDVGVGTQNAFARFDDLQVHEFFPPPPAPSTTLPVSENFDDGIADFFEAQLGIWTVELGRYEVMPATNLDGVSTLQLVDPLPANVEILATINADDATSDRFSNAFVIFDYQSPTDFKFAGAYVGADRWLVGRRTTSGWVEDATLDEAISALTDYSLTVRLEGDSVTLLAGGVTKLSHTFGDAIVDGDVGLGTRNALARFDDVQVHDYTPPPPASLPLNENFDDGQAGFFDVQTGVWSVESGRYAVSPLLNEDGVSTLRLEQPLPTNLEILATVNADAVASGRLSNVHVIFDYQSPTDFKFAGAYVGVDAWVIGHRTSSSWISDVTLDEPIAVLTDYDLQVRLEGGVVTLFVDGSAKLSHSFGESLVDGAVGLGTDNALAHYDDVEVFEYVPPPLAALPLSEDFDDGVADFFDVQSGTWMVDSGRYAVFPALDGDGVSTLRLEQPLPSSLDVQAVFNANASSVGRLSNAYVIFDYQSPTDFKFAGAYVGSDAWVIGHRTASGWISDVTMPETIDALTDYGLSVRLEGDTVTLSVDGVGKLSHTFAGSVVDGAIGLGTGNALAQFDDVRVSEFIPPQPAPLPYSENFDDGAADFFEVQSGTWTVESGRYAVTPALNQDGVSTIRIAEPLPASLDVQATLNADAVASGRLSNGYVIFDYQSPTDFKFAGAYVGADAWVIGHRNTTGWISDVTLSETIDVLTDYALGVRLEGDAVTLTVGGVTKLSYSFADSVVDGDVGVGTGNALARFDDVQVFEYVPPPPPVPATLPYSEDFSDGIADFFDVQSGTWTVEAGRYRVSPLLDQDGVSTIRIEEPLPTDLEILATFNADDASSGRFSNAFVIFDYQSATDFKFAGAYVASNAWLIGRRDQAGWVTDVSVGDAISHSTDYNLQVILQAGQVSLLVNGAVKLTHQYADSLTDGAVGIGTRNAFSSFDNVHVQSYGSQALSASGFGFTGDEESEAESGLLAGPLPNVPYAEGADGAASEYESLPASQRSGPGRGTRRSSRAIDQVMTDLEMELLFSLD